MIHFESISLSHNGKCLFTNMNLTIQKNEKALLHGKSGTGKTSLLKLILGFERPDKGRVFFNHLNLSKETIKDIRGQIFYLSQDVDLKNQTINILIKEICEINQIKRNSADLNGFLHLLDLNKKLLNQKTNQLSGGERQRVGLLIGFLLDRPVWLLDEPTSALDDIMKKKVSDFILNQNKTMIIVSHDAVWKNHSDIKIKWWL